MSTKLSEVVVILALPSKRRTSALNLSRQLAGNPKTGVVVLSFLHSDTLYFEKNCSANVDIVEVKDPYEHDQSIENLKMIGVKVLQKRSVLQASRMLLSKFAYNYLIPRFSLGLFENLVEQKVLYKILYKSELLEKIIGDRVGTEKRNIVLITEGDRGMDIEQPLLLVKKRNHNFRYVVCEIADSATEIDLSKYPQVRRKRFTLNSYRRLSQKKFSSSVYRNGYYYSHSTSNALSKLEISSDFPWRIGLSSGVDLVLLRNDESLDSMRRLNLDVSKFTVAGDVNFDFIFESWKLNQTPVLKEKENKTLVVALPNWLESPREFSKRNYRKIQPYLEILFSTLSENFESIRVVLHPKQTEARYEFLRKFPNVTLSNDSIYNEIVTGDVFCTTYSSTLNYAHVLEMPTLVLLPNFWSHTTDYANKIQPKKWSIIVNRPTAISNETLRNFYRTANAYFRSSEFIGSPEKANFDGKYAERLMSQIDSLFHSGK